MTVAATVPAVSPPSSPPPGWYPDPSGRHERRWFDGSSWTADVATGGGRSLDTTAAPDLAPAARTDPPPPPPGGVVLAAPVVVVRRVRAQPPAYEVRDQDGRVVATTVPTPGGFAVVEGPRRVLELVRPSAPGEEAIYVRAEGGAEVGRLAWARPPDAGRRRSRGEAGGPVRVELETPHAVLGSLATDDPDGDGPPVPVLDADGELVASIGRGVSGLAADVAPADRVLHRHLALVEPLRSLVAAAPFGLDLLVSRFGR